MKHFDSMAAFEHFQVAIVGQAMSFFSHMLNALIESEGIDTHMLINWHVNVAGREQQFLMPLSGTTGINSDTDQSVDDLARLALQRLFFDGFISSAILTVTCNAKAGGAQDYQSLLQALTNELITRLQEFRDTNFNEDFPSEL